MLHLNHAQGDKMCFLFFSVSTTNSTKLVVDSKSMNQEQTICFPWMIKTARGK